MFETLKAFFYFILTPVFDAIKYILFFFFDVFCSLVEFAVSLIEIPGNVASGLFNWAGLPGQVLYVINAIGLSACLSILASAYLIRFTLNLIPSWLTRV